MARLASSRLTTSIKVQISRERQRDRTLQTSTENATEFVALSKQQDKEVSNTHHARCKNASRVRLEKHRNTSTHGR